MSDKELFNNLWGDAEHSISNFLSGVIPDFHAAEEITQKVSLVCWAKFSKYERSKGFVNWAMGMAKTEVRTYRRQEARSCMVFRSDMVEEFAGVNEELNPVLEARRVALWECFGCLDERKVAALDLRGLQRLPYKAVAGQMSISVTNARTLFKRACSALRDCIAKKMDSYDTAF